VPFSVPFVKAVPGKSGGFLLGGLFVDLQGAQPLPPDLATRLAATNLVYYHWENTAERSKMLLQPVQLALMVTKRRQLEPETAAFRWLDDVTPTLGHNTTEITRTAPNELTFTRSAPAGLTALELFALGSWLEAPNFPGCDLSLPPRVRPPHLPVKKLSDSAASVSH
jgi:hypothetical protein